MTSTAELRVTMGSDKEAEILLRSLSVDSPARARSEISYSRRGKVFNLSITASDAGALRAAFNSYIRQIKIASDAIAV